jgi:multisubunit Na+/H+ antiporter MnhE subunit
MKEIIKLIFTLIAGFVVGFGVWYLIFWFVSNESDPFKWHWVTKILYLLVATSSVSSIVEETSNK